MIIIRLPRIRNAQNPSQQAVARAEQELERGGISSARERVDSEAEAAKEYMQSQFAVRAVEFIPVRSKALHIK